jgi:hypothetical protein
MGEMMGKSDTPTMPAFRGMPAEDDVRALLAHIKTWWTDDQHSMQARATHERC